MVINSSNKGKTRQPPLDNYLHSQIFYLVVLGYNYIQWISFILQKTPPAILKQINELVKIKLLTKHKEKKLNKTIYKPNWDVVVKHFFKYYSNKVEKSTEGLEFLKQSVNEWNKDKKKDEKQILETLKVLDFIKGIGILGNVGYTNKHLNNKEIQKFFKTLISNYAEGIRNKKYKKIDTINEIFDDLISQSKMLTITTKGDIAKFFDFINTYSIAPLKSYIFIPLTLDKLNQKYRYK